jgi:hypothetical protein
MPLAPVIRRRLLLVCTLALLSAGPVLIQIGNDSAPSTPKVVLVTGNFDDLQDFAHDVWKGLVGEGKPDGRYIQLALPSEDSEPRLRRQLLAGIAKHQPDLVVSADNSRVAALVLDQLAPLGVPTVVTVASNDRLLIDSDNARRYSRCFRVVANNGMQATAVLQLDATKPANLICIRDGSAYANNLSSKICSDNKMPDRFIYILDADSRNIVLHQIALMSPEDQKRVAIVFLGYYGAVGDLVTVASFLKLQCPLLLSDGCASPNLKDLMAAYPGSVYLCEPKMEGSAGAHDAETAYFRIGHSLQDALTNPEAIQRGRGPQTVEARIASTWQFDHSGQVVGASYTFKTIK